MLRLKAWQPWTERIVRFGIVIILHAMQSKKQKLNEAESAYAESCINVLPTRVSEH